MFVEETGYLPTRSSTAALLEDYIANTPGFSRAPWKSSLRAPENPADSPPGALSAMRSRTPPLNCSQPNPKQKLSPF